MDGAGTVGWRSSDSCAGWQPAHQGPRPGVGLAMTFIAPPLPPLHRRAPGLRGSAFEVPAQGSPPLFGERWVLAHRADPSRVHQGAAVHREMGVVDADAGLILDCEMDRPRRGGFARLEDAEVPAGAT